MSRKTALFISTVALLLPALLPVAQAQEIPTVSPYGGPGLFDAQLLAGQTIDAGTVSVWNSPKKLMVQIRTSGEWQIKETQIYVGYPATDPIPGRAGEDLGGPAPLRCDCEWVSREEGHHDDNAPSRRGARSVFQ